MASYFLSLGVTNGQRLGAHKDFGTLTLMMQRDIGGLEVSSFSLYHATTNSGVPSASVFGGDSALRHATSARLTERSVDVLPQVGLDGNNREIVIKPSTRPV
jgi:hypothetical protein